jgi:hypothetical protein
LNKNPKKDMPVAIIPEKALFSWQDIEKTVEVISKLVF